MNNDSTNRRVLVIDDNKAIHEDFRKILQSPGPGETLEDVEAVLFGEEKGQGDWPTFELSFANQGEEGLQQVGEAMDAGRPFAVAFVDMRMPPGWDGLKTIEQIWKKDADIQIVICTAFSEYSRNDIRDRLGVDDRLLILAKPFDNAEVYQLASSLTEKWRLGQQARLKMSELEQMVAQRTAVLQATIAQLAEELLVRKQAEGQIRHDVLHDRLTNLANRTLLNDRLAHALKRCQRDANEVFVVLVLDLDRFKVINDSLGHEAGDDLLVEVAARLKACVRSLDAITGFENELARLGGDEFVILLERLHEPLLMATIAEQLQEAVAAPFRLAGQEVHISASIGIAIGRADYQNAEDVLRDADTALYRAKMRGRACFELFDQTMHGEAVAQLELEHQLQTAIADGELRLHYQPIVTIAGEHTVAMEALVRWQHPTRGLISPGTFLPVAEETGQIVAIGDWVLREACRQCHAWQRDVPEYRSVSIHVNVAAKQFARKDFAGRVEQVLADTGLDPSFLTLEITEGTILDSTEPLTAQLLHLKRLGIRLYLDDFGTGFSSLSYLQRLPLDGLKIDQSFVSRLSSDHQSGVIVEAIIRVAEVLGLALIAEGIENTEQLALLRAMGCEQAQGYYFSRPLSVEAMESMRLKNAA